MTGLLNLKHLILLIVFLSFATTGSADTAAVFIDQPSAADMARPGEPRAGDDPLVPPEGAVQGIYSHRQEDYYLPYWTSKPGPKAVDFFRDLTEKKPDNEEYWGRYAFSLIQTGKYDEALAAGSQAVALQKDSQWGLYSLALASRSTFRNEDSVRFYNELLTTDFVKFKRFYVTKPYVAANLASLLESMDRTAEAELNYQLALADGADKVDPLTLKMLDRHYVRGGRLDLAIQLYEGILQKIPENLNALMNLGVMLTYAGRYPDAVRHLEKAAGINPRVMKIHYYLHRARWLNGDLAGAATALQRCQELNEEEQVELDYIIDVISPYPCNGIIYQQVYAAVGDARSLRRTHERIILEDLEDAPQGTIQDDQFLDMIMEAEGFPEYKEEESFRYFFDTHPGWRPRSVWMGELQKHLRPEAPGAREAAVRAAELLRLEKWGEALNAAEEGLKREPDNPMLTAQAGIAAASLRDVDRMWKLFQRARRVNLNVKNVDGQKWYFEMLGPDGKTVLEEKDETAFLARAFTVLAIIDTCVIKVRKEQDGNWKFGRTEASEWLSDEQLQELGETYVQLSERLDSLHEHTDSISGRAFSSLLLADVWSISYSGTRAAKNFKRYFEYDPDYEQIYALYQDFGKYFGY